MAFENSTHDATANIVLIIVVVSIVEAVVRAPQCRPAADMS